MKKFLLDLLEYIIDILFNRERHEIVEKDDESIINEIEIPKEETNEISTTDTSEKEPIIEEKPQEPTINLIETEQPKNNIETTPNEAYVMLTNKERQTYFKKLGLYTKKIDNIRGSGQKKAEKQFNIIFLNKNTDTYSEETDKLLRIIYKSYCESPYMKSSDWKYFKNFKKSEFYCTCNKKYCDGYNGLGEKMPMRLLMMAQYQRNYYGKPVYLSSSIRCNKRNQEVGGTSNSRHKSFRAIDKKSNGVKAKDVVNMIYKSSTTKLPFVSYSYAITEYYSHTDVTI